MFCCYQVPENCSALKEKSQFVWILLNSADTDWCWYYWNNCISILQNLPASLSTFFHSSCAKTRIRWEYWLIVRCVLTALMGEIVDQVKVSGQILSLSCNCYVKVTMPYIKLRHMLNAKRDSNVLVRISLDLLVLFFVNSFLWRDCQICFTKQHLT